MQLAQQQFADTLAAQGGLGLSRIVIDRLGHQATSQNTHDATFESDKTRGEN
jgi:Rod binding domain-containing protein